MLDYKTMYNITAGINLCFKGKSKKKLLSVTHGQKKRDQISSIFPISKYEGFSSRNFAIINLYLNFTRSPSNLESVIKLLKELDMKPLDFENIQKDKSKKDIKEVYQFKQDIINRKKLFKQDLDRILSENTSVDIGYMIDEYKANRIKWFTLMFYIKGQGLKLNQVGTRLDKLMLEKIEKLSYYFTFTEEEEIVSRVLSNKNKIKVV
jgi:hypothetical protein